MKPKFRALDRLTGKMFPVGIIDYSIQSVYIEEPNEMYCERDFDDVETKVFSKALDFPEDFADRLLGTVVFAKGCRWFESICSC